MLESAEAGGLDGAGLGIPAACTDVSEVSSKLAYLYLFINPTLLIGERPYYASFLPSEYFNLSISL